MYFLKNSKKNQENYFYKIKFSKKVHGYRVLLQKIQKSSRFIDKINFLKKIKYVLFKNSKKSI